MLASTVSCSCSLSAWSLYKSSLVFHLMRTSLMPPLLLIQRELPGFRLILYIQVIEVLPRPNVSRWYVNGLRSVATVHITAPLKLGGGLLRCSGVCHSDNAARQRRWQVSWATWAVWQTQLDGVSVLVSLLTPVQLQLFKNVPVMEGVVGRYWS